MRFAADLRTLGFMGVYFALTATLWLVPQADLFSGGSWYLAVPMLVLTSFFSFFCAVATHNTVHCPVFKKRGANRVFQVALTLTYGHPVSAFVPGHNLSHHKHTQTPRDVMRTSKVRYRWNLLNVLLFLLHVAPAIMRGESRYFAAMKVRAPGWFRQLRIEQVVLYGLYAVLLYADWQKFLLYVFIPHKYAAWGIVTMNLLQHDGCDEKSEWNHSRNFTGKLVNWFTFNNGFHTIHHMTPGLHWSLCPAEHMKQVHPHIHPALEQRSLVAYCFRAFIWPAKRMTYDGKPLVLPPLAADEDWVPRPEETQGDLGAVPVG